MTCCNLTICLCAHFPLSLSKFWQKDRGGLKGTKFLLVLQQNYISWWQKKSHIRLPTKEKACKNKFLLSKKPRQMMQIRKLTFGNCFFCVCFISAIYYSGKGFRQNMLTAQHSTAVPFPTWSFAFPHEHASSTDNGLKRTKFLTDFHMHIYTASPFASNSTSEHKKVK